MDLTFAWMDKTNKETKKETKRKKKQKKKRIVSPCRLLRIFFSEKKTRLPFKTVVKELVLWEMRKYWVGLEFVAWLRLRNH